MTLSAEEFMRRFLLHVLPSGFHRIRHYGLLANGARTANLALARELLNDAPAQHVQAADADTGHATAAQPCLRLPALRWPDAHRRDLHARPDDSRTAAAAARIMSAIVCPRSARSPSASAAADSGWLCLARDRDLACSPPHRTTQRFGATAARLSDVTGRLIGGGAHRQPELRRAQIPIGSSPSSNHRATRRGFLPRGLSNTCPQTRCRARVNLLARAGVGQPLT